MAYIKNYTYNIPNIGVGSIKSDMTKLKDQVILTKEDKNCHLYLLLFGNQNVDVYDKNAVIDPEINIKDLITNGNIVYLDNFIDSIMKNYPDTESFLINNLELLKNAKTLDDPVTLEQIYLRTLTDIKRLTNQSFTLDPLGNDNYNLPKTA